MILTTSSLGVTRFSYEERKMSFLKSVAKKETLSIRVQPKLKNRLEKVAQSYGISVSSLMRIWFIDKLKKTEGSGLSVQTLQ